MVAIRRDVTCLANYSSVESTARWRADSSGCHAPAPEAHGAGAAPGGGAARAAVNHVLPPPVGGGRTFITYTVNRSMAQRQEDDELNLLAGTVRSRAVNLRTSIERLEAKLNEEPQWCERFCMQSIRSSVVT